MLTVVMRREYDREDRRFLQTDPVPGGPANAYDYGGQDPINRADLDGRMLGPIDVGGSGPSLLLTAPTNEACLAAAASDTGPKLTSVGNGGLACLNAQMALNTARAAATCAIGTLINGGICGITPGSDGSSHTHNLTQPQPEPTPTSPRNTSARGGAVTVLYHYTSAEGAAGITASQQILPSRNEFSVFGQGQYFTDIDPLRLAAGNPRDASIALFGSPRGQYKTKVLFRRECGRYLSAAGRDDLSNQLLRHFSFALCSRELVAASDLGSNDG